jgi:NAD(P)-dependent dehydrogenase (short-subunit alcohol dehydrogenase family)
MSKKVLVTGVARGIGRGIAERFLQEGYELFGTFCTSEGLARQLEAEYGPDRVHLFGPYDFQNLENTKAFLAKLKEYTFDTVVCSAGMFSEQDDFNDFDLSEFERTMNCNFYTPLIITTGLKDNIVEGGSIVIISSNDAYPGAYSSISYSVSKSALLSLMKSLCVNYGAKNIRVNSVAPGAIDTDMNTPEQMILGPYFSPIARAGTPEDVAKVVFFLASDEAAFISGANITIDGGYTNVSVLLKAEADPAFSMLVQNFIKEKG